MKDYDLRPILKVLNEAHEKIMELTVKPKKKVSKRKKALVEIGSFIENYNVSYVEFRFKRDVLRKIEQMLLEDEQNNK